MDYSYEPFFGPDDLEIPCFRIYADGEPIAETNEDMPADFQEKAAILFTVSEDLLLGLKRAVNALNMLPPFLTKESILSDRLIDELQTVLARTRGFD